MPSLRKVFVAVLAAMLVVAGGAVIGHSTPAGASLASPFTGAFLDIERNSSMFGQYGLNQATTFPSVTVSQVNGQGIDQFTFLLTKGNLGVRVLLSAPNDQPLTVGTYDGAVYPFTAPTSLPGISVTVVDTICFGEGNFTVDEATYSGATLTAFAAQFEFQCTGDAGALFGDISYNSTANFDAVSPSTNDLEVDTGGLAGNASDVSLTNSGQSPVSLSGFSITGPNAPDFGIIANTCGPSLAVDATCDITIGFVPSSDGASESADLHIYDVLSPTGPPGEPEGLAAGRVISLDGESFDGYYVAGSQGEVGNFGDAPYLGDASNETLVAPVVGMTVTPDGGGYWEVASDGGIFAFGDAAFYGSMGARVLNRPIVGIAATPDGGGYWEVASDGGIFAFGDAAFYGSMGARVLNRPIVGIAATPDGGGYWEVASDGGIFAFGDAAFYGSMGGRVLNRPIVGIAATPDGGGYWEVASDGGIFAFGDAAFYGSTGNLTLDSPIIGLSSSPDGGGYWIAASDGGIFAFGDAPFMGSLGGQGVTDVVAIAPLFTGFG